MRDRLVPIFYEKKTASTAQYANLLQGVRTAAARNGLHVQLIPEEGLDGLALDFYLPSLSLPAQICQCFSIQFLSCVPAAAKPFWQVLIPNLLARTYPASLPPAARKPSSLSITFTIAIGNGSL